MSFTVRSLLGRVKPFRPDMDRGDVDYILQEAARRVIQESFSGRETKQVFFLPKNVNQICMSPQMAFYSSGAPNLAGTPGYSAYGINYTQMVLPAGGDVDPTDSDQRMPVDIVRINKLRIARPPLYANDPTFHGYSESIPASTLNWVAGDFVIMSLAGTGTNTDATTMTWNNGDMMYWDGTLWNVFTVEQYSTVNETNAASFEKNNIRPQMTPSIVSYWSQDSGGGGSIDFFDEPAISGDIAVTSSGGLILLSVSRYGGSDNDQRVPEEVPDAVWESTGGSSITLLCSTSAPDATFEWTVIFDKDVTGMPYMSVDAGSYEGECTITANGWDASIVDSGINVIATCIITSGTRSASVSQTIPYFTMLVPESVYDYTTPGEVVPRSYEAKVCGDSAGYSIEWSASVVSCDWPGEYTEAYIASGQGTSDAIVGYGWNDVGFITIQTSLVVTSSGGGIASATVTATGAPP